MSQLGVQAADLADVVLRFAIGRNTAIFLDRAFARIIGGNGFRHIALEPLQQPAQVTHPAVNIVDRVEGVPHAEPCRGGRDKLHQSLCIGGGYGVSLIGGFNLDDGEHQLWVQPILGCKLGDQGADFLRRIKFRPRCPAPAIRAARRASLATLTEYPGHRCPFRMPECRRPFEPGIGAGLVLLEPVPACIEQPDRIGGIGMTVRVGTAI